MEKPTVKSIEAAIKEMKLNIDLTEPHIVKPDEIVKLVQTFYIMGYDEARNDFDC